MNICLTLARVPVPVPIHFNRRTYEAVSTIGWVTRQVVLRPAANDNGGIAA